MKISHLGDDFMKIPQSGEISCKSSRFGGELMEISHLGEIYNIFSFEGN